MNRHIIVAVIVVGGSGVLNSWTASPPKPITPVILGSIVLLLVLAIADALGGAASSIATAIAYVAMIYALINEFPWGILIPWMQGYKPPTTKS